MRAFLTIFAGALALAFWVYCLLDCIRSPTTRGLPKPVWVIIIIVLPLLGALLWVLIGKDRLRRSAARKTQPRYPDDDPSFLRQMGADAERDERIRELEEELAKLDDEQVGTPGDDRLAADSAEPSTEAGDGPDADAGDDQSDGHGGRSGDHGNDERKPND